MVYRVDVKINAPENFRAIVLITFCCIKVNLENNRGEMFSEKVDSWF